MSVIDRIIAALSPAWAWRRQQFREALRQAQETEEPRRPDGGGWMPLNHPNNPLNPVNLDCVQEERRRGPWR
jgi:hypothetical protein